MQLLLKRARFVRTYPWLADECYGYSNWDDVSWYYSADETHDPTREVVFTDLYLVIIPVQPHC